MITPHADALVAAGITMERSYVFQYCAPTRSSIMSGRLPYHVNQVILGMNNPDWDMPSEMTAMPRKLKQGGYATHMVGSASTRLILFLRIPRYLCGFWICLLSEFPSIAPQSGT